MTPILNKDTDLDIQSPLYAAFYPHSVGRKNIRIILLPIQTRLFLQR